MNKWLKRLSNWFLQIENEVMVPFVLVGILVIGSFSMISYYNGYTMQKNSELELADTLFEDVNRDLNFLEKRLPEEEIAEKYRLRLSGQARALLERETPKQLPNVTVRVTGSVRQLCAAAQAACRSRGYAATLLTDRLCCQAREAGAFLGAIAQTHAGQGKLAFLAGGETVVRLLGDGKGGRNQELALSAAPYLAGAASALFSIGSDGTDGPTDAAGGYVDGRTLEKLEKAGCNTEQVLDRNDAYTALDAVGGLIRTGPTGTNVNDVAVLLIRPNE